MSLSYIIPRKYLNSSTIGTKLCSVFFLKCKIMSYKELGYIVSKDRFGTTRNFNLLSVSCSIIEINSQSNILNFDDTLNSMKKESKSSKEPVYKVL